MRLLKLAVIATALILTGCAASGPKHADMKSSITTIEPGKGRVYFYRDSGFVGGGVRPDIMLNGSVVGSSVPGGFFYADRAPGNYSVATSTEVEKKLTFGLAAGETKYVKTTISVGLLVGRVIPELVSPAEAEQQLVSLSFTGETTARK